MKNRHDSSSVDIRPTNRLCDRPRETARYKRRPPMRTCRMPLCSSGAAARGVSVAESSAKRLLNADVQRRAHFISPLVFGGPVVCICVCCSHLFAVHFLDTKCAGEGDSGDEKRDVNSDTVRESVE
jgi:hypothetical protein